MYGASNIDQNGGSHAAAQAISDMWYYSEVNLYPQSAYGRSNPDMGGFHDWGHYTQVVWKNTVEVGCASKLCPAGTIVGGMASWYTVCNYHPPGMPLLHAPSRNPAANRSRQETSAASTARTSRPPSARRPCRPRPELPTDKPPERSRRAAQPACSCVMHPSSNREQAQGRRRVAWKRKYHRIERRPSFFVSRFASCTV